MTENSKNESPRTFKVEVYLKALPIRELADINTIKMEVGSGNIVIANITFLAKKSIEDTKLAVDELCRFIKNLGGEIARLGNERLVLTPPSIRIWKEEENLR